MLRVWLLLFTLVGISAAASPALAQQAKQPEKAKAIDLLFPLNKVTLGKTTVDELAKLGKREAQFTVVKGIDFWHEKGVAHHIYLTNSRGMPCSWEQQGFDYELSYDGWLKLFEKLGWEVKVTQQPKSVKHDFIPTKCLQAQLQVTSGEILLTLDFNFGRDGDTTAALNTLYSIRAEWTGGKK